MIIVNNPAAGIGKNFFKNPNFAVIQGTASGTLANSTALPTASLGYLGETEWCIAASGGTPAYAFSAVDESVTFTGAASTTAIYLLQRLESRDTNRLKNKTVTISCEISNSLLTSVIWEVFRPTTSDDVHGTIASPTQTLVASGTFTVNSTLTRYSATFALPDLASRGLEIRLRVGAQTSGTWVVSRLQLEEGSVVTDFNCGEYSRELQKCQRYFETSYPSGTTIGGFSNVVGIGGTSLVATEFYNSHTPILFTVKKRAYPVMTGYSCSGTINTFYNLTGFDQGSIVFRHVSDHGFTFASLDNLPSQTGFGAHYTASAHIP